VQTVHPIDKAQRILLDFGGDAGRVFEIQDRILAAAKDGALIDRRQIAGAVSRRARFGGSIRHHDERRQILVLRAQPVDHPGAEGRPHELKGAGLE